MPDAPISTKSFFSRPEGKTALILPAIGIGVLIWIMGSSLMDYIIGALVNTLELGIILGSLMLLVLARKPLFYMYRSFCRFLTGLIIDIDPIGILKTYKEKLTDKLEEMRKSIDLLNGQKIKVQRIIEKNNTDIEHSMGLVDSAVKRGGPDAERVKALEGNQAIRLQAENQRISTDYNRICFLINVLGRYYTLSSDQIVDMGREIDSRERERKYSKESQSAVRSAMGILKGLPGDKDMYDQSLEVLEQQYSDAIGEVEHFLDMTKDIIATSDLQNGADADKAMKMLDDWQKKNSGMTMGNSTTGVSKATIIDDARKQLAAVPASITINTGKPQYQSMPQSATSASKGDDDYLSMVK